MPALHIMTGQFLFYSKFWEEPILKITYNKTQCAKLFFVCTIRRILVDAVKHNYRMVFQRPVLVKRLQWH